MKVSQTALYLIARMKRDWMQVIYIYIYINYRETYFIFISFTSTIKKKKKIYIIYRLAENLVGSVVQHYISLLFHMGTAFQIGRAHV